MATISSLGTGSGLPLSTLLDNLTTAEKKRLTPITTQQKSYSSKLTAYGSLKSAMQAFSDATNAMAKASIYKSTTVTSSNTGAFTATTAAGAAAGKYSVTVSQLAQAQTLVSGKTADTTTALGSTTGGDRTLTIAQGNGDDPMVIKLSDSQTSLGEIRDAINAANGGVNASIVKVSDSDYQLVLTSNDTGTSSEMTVSVTGDDKLNDFIGYTAGGSKNGMTESVNAQNAKLTVNNIEIERDSNTITDAPQGITLNLVGVTSSAQTLTVSKDISKASSAIASFVSAYNTLQTTFNNLTKYTAVDSNTEGQDSSNGALLGDSTLRDIQTKLKNTLSSMQGPSPFNSLSNIGITQNADTGVLEINNDKLNAALNTDATAVSTLIAGNGKTTGVGTLMNKLNTDFLANGGPLDNATTGVNNTLKQLTKQYNAVNRSIVETMERYKTQFTALDVMVTKLNSTSSYLTQQFQAMNPPSK